MPASYPESKMAGALTNIADKLSTNLRVDQIVCTLMNSHMPLQTTIRLANFVTKMALMDQHSVVVVFDAMCMHAWMWLQPSLRETDPVTIRAFVHTWTIRTVCKCPFACSSLNLLVHYTIFLKVIIIIIIIKSNLFTKTMTVGLIDHLLAGDFLLRS